MINIKPGVFASIISALLVTASTCSLLKAQNRQETSLESPDHKTKIELKLTEAGQLSYQLKFNGQRVTEWSLLGLETSGPVLSNGIRIESHNKTKHKNSFDWPLGEDKRINNVYHQLVLHCKSSNAKFDLVMRAYNGSFGFRYIDKDIGIVKLHRELTEFNLADSYDIFQYHEESIFRRVSLNDLSGICDLPATLVSGKKLYISIGEAENRNFTKCVLVKGQTPNSLKFNFYTDTIYKNGKIQSINKDSNVGFRDSLISPWRTISCSTTAIGLHEFSQLNLKLTTPLTNEVPLNIKPGKVFRVPVTTNGGIGGIDLAKKMNFQYIMFDAGWYGAEFRTTSDPTKAIPELDLPKVIEYGRVNGIGVILYVNYVGLKAKLDTILPLYKKWGVSGLKFGFVDGGTQSGLAWLDTAVKKTNDYGFILNIHDHYKPTGLSRRYPYLLSQEGIRGDENSPDAFHNTVLPFTRFIAGPADFTFCYPNAANAFSKNIKVSKVQQLALTVIYFDPLQAIFWYGRPEDYNTNDPDLQFLKAVPTVWDESKYLKGDIGESICVARRKGEVWYLGSASGLIPLSTELQLSFLRKHTSYTATIYEDDGNNGVKIITRKVTSKDKLPVQISEKSGQAVIVSPTL
ncbi:glycoside hydrolase family 97 catalytic domain-containing protein [Mucilaginibacter sp. ZT4R22]|uniref:Glycoside hydrolase family 97 catalytic domain-containing protein n=1 Tax=Mucilaginibacter pankratovii TaxID=2772110 RepID=A0ABR7WMG2_9SPHI|nr:glycoside hydrolase family 97 protein [Mucilaginibacter pankratovii]MBD1362692.1 glycoside hydrolase family 97 catalytic domain-containing protein [Mucilaginibacter pankratovii]